MQCHCWISTYYRQYKELLHVSHDNAALLLCIYADNNDNFSLLLCRFKEGLSVMGVLEAVTQHPCLFKPLLCHSLDLLTPDVVADLFQPKMSEPGSNRRSLENLVYSFWLDYLKDIGGNCNHNCKRNVQLIADSSTHRLHCAGSGVLAGAVAAKCCFYIPLVLSWLKVVYMLYEWTDEWSNSVECV